MTGYNKLFIAIILMFNFELLFAQVGNDIDIFHIGDDNQELYENQSLSQRVKTPPIQEVSVMDSSLILLIDSVLHQEKECAYFSNDLCLGILFARDRDSIYNDYYYIKIESCDRNTLLDLRPIGYFLHQNIYVFVYDIVELPKELFSYSNTRKDFNHYIDYGDYGIEDDRYSMYFYWYVNNEFFFDRAYKCKK